MAVYLGAKKIGLNLNGTLHKMVLYAQPPTLRHIAVTASDGSMLTDANGLYITVKEDN